MLHFTLCKPQTTEVTMFISQRSSGTALLSVLVVLFLFSTKVQTDASTDTNSTTSSSAETNTTLSMHLNSSMARKFRSCGTDFKDFCANGGQCVFFQDSNKPSCQCQLHFEGERCMTVSPSHSCQGNQPEQLIGIIIGVLMIIIALVIIAFCCFYNKRCMKSAPLKTSSPMAQV